LEFSLKTTEENIKKVISSSLFKDHISNFEIFEGDYKKKEEDEPEQNSKKQGQKSKRCRISSEHSSIISGLKCFLQEMVPEFVAHLSEDFFNLEAKPFVPKGVKD
jgi:hypothetical protein